MPRAFYLLLAVQFLSTLADNAFLIVAIARVMELSGDGWIVPVLKISATVCYVLLAPFVGPLADAFAKGRVMVAANALKVSAMLLLLAGWDPLLAIGLAGLGSAIYAPAKYGLITETLQQQLLVRANGFFEGVTVCAVILGTVVGGVLISPVMPEVQVPEFWKLWGVASTHLYGAMLTLFMMNFAAALMSFAVADSGARYDAHSIHPLQLVKAFARENSILWRDAMGGMSMSVTTLLWAVGATLQLIVLRWAHEALGLPLEKAAYLQGVTALGVICGAVAASRCVALSQTTKVLPIGVVLGALIPLMLCITTVTGAALLLTLVGALAGFFVVPMNALLQHRGHTLLTAGRSIAVQGFNENGGMLLMLAVYAGAIALDISLHGLILGFSCTVTAGMLVIWVSNLLQSRRVHA
jgi:MFS family permease